MQMWIFWSPYKRYRGFDLNHGNIIIQITIFYRAAAVARFLVLVDSTLFFSRIRRSGVLGAAVVLENINIPGMYICTDICRPVVWAIENSYLDHVLSRKRPNSRWGPPFGVLFARHASPCSPLPTLPGAASAVCTSSPSDGCCFLFVFLRQNNVITQRRMLFFVRFFRQNNCSDPKRLFVRIDTLLFSRHASPSEFYVFVAFANRVKMLCPTRVCRRFNGKQR